MYLPDEKATALNELYERIDARSKIAGDGGIEKHADFMEQLVEFAVAHESELADQLGVES
jgi:dihydroorotate dehydrogenase